MIENGAFLRGRAVSSLSVLKNITRQRFHGLGRPHRNEQPATGAFPPFDPKTFPSTIFWLVVTFGLLYLAMARFALPRVSSILKSRSERIHGDIAAAHKLRDEAKEASAAYDKTLREARARSQELAAETRTAVKFEQDSKRQKLEAELNGKLVSAEQRIAEMKASAMANVGQIATETASAIVQHITGREADPTAVAKAIADSRT